MGRREKGAAAAALALLFTALWQGGQAGATRMDVDSAQSEISSLDEEGGEYPGGAGRPEK